MISISNAKKSEHQILLIVDLGKLAQTEWLFQHDLYPMTSSAVTRPRNCSNMVCSNQKCIVLSQNWKALPLFVILIDGFGFREGPP